MQDESENKEKQGLTKVTEYSKIYYLLFNLNFLSDYLYIHISTTIIRMFLLLSFAINKILN